MKYLLKIERPIKKKRGRKPLSKLIVRAAQKLYARGFTMRETAARVGIALGSVYNILSGKHPNQEESLEKIQRDEAVKLYNRLCKKKRRLRRLLPPLREISSMTLRGRFLNVYSVIAYRKDGVMVYADWLGGGRAGAAGQIAA